MRVSACERSTSFIIGLIALIAIVQPTSSSVAAPVAILFEVRSTTPSRSSDAIAAELRQLLRARAVEVEPQAIAELGNEVLPIDGRWDADLLLTDVTSQLDLGVRSYLRGNFKVAEQQLTSALRLAQRNPAMIVADATARTWLTQALSSLALARLRLRDRAGATAAMAEQIRSFPESPLSRADHGGRGEALYSETRRALEAGPRGSLLVDVSDPDARIYVNEFGRGRGGAFTSDMFPGSYRVLVMVGARGRLYRVSVHPDTQTRLSIDWAMDSALQSSRRWIGFSRASGHTVPPTGLMRQLAKRLAFKDAIFISISQRPEGSVVWGGVYERATGRALRAGQVRVTSGTSILPLFADFLATGSHADEIGQATEAAGRDLVHPAAPIARPLSAHPPQRSQTSQTSQTSQISQISIWAFAITGMVATGTGGYLAVRDRDPPSGPAIAIMSGGLISLGISSFLYLDARRAKPHRSAAVGWNPMRRGGVASVSWQF
jgi:hypothetical protein